MDDMVPDEVTHKLRHIDFCQFAVDAILISGGELTTAYKCALLFARDLEEKNDNFLG